jgi:hypothetical protein
VPPAHGGRISIRFAPALTVSRGKLLSGELRGSPVHAGSFLPGREIVLESVLVERPKELARILVHEIFHFAWVRLGNPRRWSYEALLKQEAARGARGELGWSADLAKRRLVPEDRTARSRRWREYVCESFCDTAAWLFSGAAAHREFTLSPAFRARRRAWFAAVFAGRVMSL